VDLAPIITGLPYDELIIWNDLERGSQGCYGRWLAMDEAKHDTIFFVDDDVVFTAHDELLAAHKPGQMTSNMPSPWYEHMSYDRLGLLLVGAGSLVPRDLPFKAFAAYLEHWPLDDLFQDYCDFVNGMLTPGQRFDFGYEIMEYAVAPGRINTKPNSSVRRATVLNRMLHIREAAA
jgi:hypothetical protein